VRGLGFADGRDYERESVAFYPGSFVIFDYSFKQHAVAFEIDGSIHRDRGQANHDIGRDAYFKSQGIRTVRLANSLVLNKDLVRKFVLAELRMPIT
jgi:very-short-patch-repair endonuclease